jgi:phage baseplate assembly protein W
MSSANSIDRARSFLGTGWGFPPEFAQNGRSVQLTSDEEDIRASLQILFGTARGERTLAPRYGLDAHELLFEPLSTTLKAFLRDRMTTDILVYEPRIRVLSLQIEDPDPVAGVARIALEYEIRSTNSRYNLVFPFYESDANEIRDATRARAPRTG